MNDNDNDSEEGHENIPQAMKRKIKMKEASGACEDV
jgi:hypothetical protein